MKDEQMILEKAIEKAGGKQKQLARSLNVSEAAISTWKKIEQSKKDLPESVQALLQAFLLDSLPYSGLSMFSSDSMRNLTMCHDIYAALIGLEFESVYYRCSLYPSAKESTGFADARVETIYKGPRVTAEIGVTTFTITNVSDGESDKSSTIEFSGPGVEYDANNPRDNYILLREEYKPPLRPNRPKVVRVHSVRISTDASRETEIKVSRNLVNGFTLRKMSGEDPIQYAGYKVARPTRRLRLELDFSELPKALRELEVNVNAWGPWSLKMSDFDYKRITSLLANNSPRPLGEGVWVWESQAPLVMGMFYALTYDPEEACELLKERK